MRQQFLYWNLIIFYPSVFFKDSYNYKYNKNTFKNRITDCRVLIITITPFLLGGQNGSFLSVFLSIIKERNIWYHPAINDNKTFISWASSMMVSSSYKLIQNLSSNLTGLALDFSLDYVILHQPRLCSKSDTIFFLSSENISKI